MKILILVSLFLSILSATVPVVNDITFNTNYPVTSGGYYIPAGSSIYLRMEIIKDDQMEVCLTTYDYFLSYFKVYVSLFPKRPTDSDIVYYSYGTELSYDGTTVVNDYYTQYNYPFETDENSKYLGIYIHIYNSLNYLDVMVISVTGLIWAAIVGGAVLFIALVVGGIFGYRKYRR